MSTAGSWTTSTPIETRLRSPSERSLMAAARHRVRSCRSASTGVHVFGGHGQRGTQAKPWDEEQRLAHRQQREEHVPLGDVA
jgi:hypothetical protein